VSFDKIVDGEALAKEGASILQNFKIGSSVKVAITSEGDFTLIKAE
jgi:hypothetical protein